MGQPPIRYKNIQVKKPPNNKPWIWNDYLDKQLKPGNRIKLDYGTYFTLFYSGTNNGVRKNGMSIIVHKCLFTLLKSFEPVNDRICYVILKGKYFDVAVISCCYGLTKEKEIEEKDNFEMSMTDYLDIVLKYLRVILIPKSDRSLCTVQR